MHDLWLLCLSVNTAQKFKKPSFRVSTTHRKYYSKTNLSSKLNEIGQILQAFGHHEQGALRVRRRRARHQSLRARLHQRRADQAEEDETWYIIMFYEY